MPASLQPTGGTRSGVVLDSDFFAGAIPEIGCWQRPKVPGVEEQGEFLTARLSADISVTRSRARFARPYCATIIYDEPTTLLVFGLYGRSRLAVGDGAAASVTEGDVWLLQVSEGVLRRSTPAAVPTGMAVLKVSTRRLRALLGPTASARLQGDLSCRLASGASAGSWPEQLFGNRLETVPERLLAESQALAVLARWAAPMLVEAAPSGARQNPSANRQIVEAVTDWLGRDLVCPPTLEELAARVGISHVRLNRLFRQVHGLTVFQWLREQRLQRARQELATTAASITDIALACGFSSASHFAERFRNRFGLTPTQFRDEQFGGSGVDDKARQEAS